MKAIMIKNKILSLENVKSVEIRSCYFGNKKDPIDYSPGWVYVRIHYTDGDYVDTPATKDSKLAKSWMKEIFELL